MNKKFFLIIIGLISIFIFGGNQFSKNQSEPIDSKTAHFFTDHEKPEPVNCPYLQQKAETKCPFLNSRIEESSSACPYLKGKTECPYLNEKVENEICPYLKSSSKKRIKNSSS